MSQIFLALFLLLLQLLSLSGEGLQLKGLPSGEYYEQHTNKSIHECIHNMHEKIHLKLIMNEPIQAYMMICNSIQYWSQYPKEVASADEIWG